MKTGIVSVYFPRGGGNICRQIIQALKWHTDDEIFVLARMSVADNKKQIKFYDEFFHENLFLYPQYNVDDLEFESWITTNKLDKVVFVEEHFTKNLVDVCNRLKVPCYNYVVWEAINPAQKDFYSKFTGLICPTKSCYNLLYNDLELKNASYIPWGVDLDTYIYHEPVKKDKPIIFFPAGYGGVNDRKNEDAVLKAFSYICTRDKAVLSVHTQKENNAGRAQNLVKTSGVLSEYELIKRYADACITVIPSRWEGNCLPQMESLALGRPVIVPNAPPMNERVIDGKNGFLCKIKEFKEIPGIFCKSAEIDIWDFAIKLIEISENKELLYEMQIASRLYAELNLDWSINSKLLVDLII